MSQSRCKWCKARFFADEDDMFEGEITCCYCKPKLRKCLMCNEVKLHKQDLIYESEICPECNSNFGGFASKWEILRFKLLKKDDFTCRYCGASPLKDKEVNLHIDHILPKAKGGENIEDNLVTSCSNCNQGKLDHLLEKHQEEKIKFRKVYYDRD